MPALSPADRGQCQTCQVKIAGNRFYCDEHKPAKKPPTRRRQANKAVQSITTRPLGAASDIASAGGAPKAKPSIDQTAKIFARVMVYLSAILAMQLISGDPDLTNDHDAEELAKVLALSDDQAAAMVHPLARFIAPTSMWQKYGTAVIEHSDILECLVAFYEYGSGIAKYQKDKRRRIALRAGGSPRPSQPVQFRGPTSEQLNGDDKAPNPVYGEGRQLSRAEIAQAQAEFEAAHPEIYGGKK